MIKSIACLHLCSCFVASGKHCHTTETIVFSMCHHPAVLCESAPILCMRDSLPLTVLMCAERLSECLLYDQCMQHKFRILCKPSTSITILYMQGMERCSLSSARSRTGNTRDPCEQVDQYVSYYPAICTSSSVCI